MAMDPYALCPCGSGKKVKFCCQDIIPEMEKVERLQENNQPRMALQILEKLEKTHPDNPWIITHQGLSLIHDGRFDDARTILGNFLRSHTDDSLANALYGLASYSADGYPKAKKAVHRAFLRSATHHAGIVGILASSLAAYHLEMGEYMAARHHLALTMRVGDEQQRKRAFMALLELDGDASIPFPLRGVHTPPEYTGNAQTHDSIRKSHKLAMIGCWQEAADLLTQVAAQDPDSAALQQTIGLYRAWDGNEAAAAAALHRAAQLSDSIDTAVECETIAQLLDLRAPEHALKMRVARYRVESISRLLSELDENPQIVPMQTPPEERDEDGDPAGRLLVLNRPVPSDFESFTPENVPVFLGQLTLFDRMEDEGEEVPAQAYLSALTGEPLDQAREIFERAGGDWVSADPLPEQEQDPDVDVTGLISRDQAPLHWNYYFPPKTPGALRRQLEERHWTQITDEIWMESPLFALGGKSPQEASGDAELRVPLTAAAIVLDAFCDARSFILAEGPLRERLALDPPLQIELGDDTNLSTLSVWRLRQLNLQSLSEEDFRHVLQRALLIHHAGFMHAVLNEYLRRAPADDDMFQRQRAFVMLAEVCRKSLRQEEAFAWLERGRADAEQQENSFQHLLQWKMRELTLRIADSDEDAITSLLMDLWQNYGRKLPPLRAQLSELVAALGIAPPWETAIVTPGAVESATSRGWSPLGAPQPAGEKKLWLPGQ